MQHIFNSCDSSGGGKVTLTLDEFCEAYISKYLDALATANDLQVKLSQIESELVAAKQQLETIQSSEKRNSEGMKVNAQGESEGTLQVTLIDAKNLASMDYSGTSDVFVAMSVEASSTSTNSTSGSIHSSAVRVCGEPSVQKSQVQWKQLHPQWNEEFLFAPILRKVTVFKLAVQRACSVLVVCLK